MGQEDAEDKISFDCLRKKVDEAIKTKNICTIEQIEDEKQLRYIQKYAELKVSKDEISVGMGGIVLAIIAIGVSYLLVNFSEFQKSRSTTIGLLFILLGVIVWLAWSRKYEPETEFIHEIILKIEEKLPTLKDDIVHEGKIIMHEEKSKDEWDIMKSEVTDAIDRRKASDVDFSNKNIYQCKYQQKCAEVEKSEFPPVLSAIIFGLGGGVGLISRFKIDDLASIIQTIIGLILIYVAWFYFYKKVYKPGHETCQEIIINAEKRIQELQEKADKERFSHLPP